MRAALLAPLVLVAVVAIALAGRELIGNRNEEDLGVLLDRVVESGAPGVLVVVREDGKRRAEARGLAELDGSIPMRTNERFRVGSITKTFVAALALKLAEDGRLELDDPVERWLPGLVPNGEAISVRDLLSHTSGLADYTEDPRIARDSGRHWQPRELVSVAIAQRPSAPRQRFSYASTNYVLLGLIVERAGGKPLGRQLRERLFEPLALRNTSFVPGEIRGPYVHGHRAPSHQGIVTGPPTELRGAAWWTWAAGGIVSTADDVQRFYAALLRGDVIGPRALREMESLIPAGRNRYGLGIATYPTACGTAWGHTGNVQGTIAVAWNTRDTSRQLVLVVNTSPLSPELEEAVRRLQAAAFCGPLATG